MALSQRKDPRAERINMFTAEQYRARAVEYSRLVKIANSPAEIREFKRLEHTFTELADNAQWTVDNYDKILHATSRSTGACKSEDGSPTASAQATVGRLGAWCLPTSSGSQVRANRT
jgi:hypothetical protein